MGAHHCGLGRSACNSRRAYSGGAGIYEERDDVDIKLRLSQPIDALATFLYNTHMATGEKEKSITQKILRKELGSFTEEVLLPMMDKRFEESEARVEARMDTKLDQLKYLMTDQFHHMLTAAENILSRLDTKEQENLAHDHMHKAMGDDLAQHGKRIAVLEKTINIKR